MGWERRKASESGGFLYQPVPSFAWNPNWCLYPGHFSNGLPWTADTQKWELRAEGRECICWLPPHSCLSLDKFSHGSWIPSHFWGVVWLSGQPQNPSGSVPGVFSRTSKFHSPLTLGSLKKYHFLNMSLMGSSPLTVCQRCERLLPRQNLYPGCSVWIRHQVPPYKGYTLIFHVAPLKLQFARLGVKKQYSLPHTFRINS